MQKNIITIQNKNLRKLREMLENEFNITTSELEGDLKLAVKKLAIEISDFELRKQATKNAS